MKNRTNSQKYALMNTYEKVMPHEKSMKCRVTTADKENGIYYTLSEMPINGHKKANAKIIIRAIYNANTDNVHFTDIFLQSYNTLVLHYRIHTSTLYCSGLFSRTTIKHISWALHSDYFPKIDYYDFKKRYIDANNKNKNKEWLTIGIFKL